MSKKKRTEHVRTIGGYPPFLVQADYLFLDGSSGPSGWGTYGVFETWEEAEAWRRELDSSHTGSEVVLDHDENPVILGERSGVTLTRVVSLGELILEGGEAVHRAILGLFTSDHEHTLRIGGNYERTEALFRAAKIAEENR